MPTWLGKGLAHVLIPTLARSTCNWSGKKWPYALSS